MTMPAGTYYIGDLCYVLGSIWDKVCEATIVAGGTIEGEFVVQHNGRDIRFAMYDTLYGDGEYSCSAINEPLGVDSGSVGCVLMSDVELLRDNTCSSEFGAIVEMSKPFKTGSTESGMIIFGRVVVFTGDDE